MFRLFILFLLAGLSLTFTTSQAQTTRFVSTTGTNSNPVSATSWATSTTNLQGAINASASGDQVWVAAGVYKPTTTTGPASRTISFAMKNGVTVYGGFAGNETALSGRPVINPNTGAPSSTTLSGDIGTPNNTTDNSYHVFYHPVSLSLTNTAVLDGFVITGGNANGTPFPNTSGGGMFNNGSGSGNSCNPLIRNCSFRGNAASTATSAGGAMHNEGGVSGQSSPVLTNCSFQSNTATYGGAISSNGSYSGISSPVMTDCVFLNNVTFNFGGASFNLGGALFNLSVGGTSSATLTNCTFLGNKSQEGGAIYNSGGSNGNCNPVLTNCSFQSNTATSQGGAMYNYGTSNNTNPELIRCVFQSNIATLNGGALYNDGNFGTSNPSLINCTFLNNSAGNAGGAINNYGNRGISTPNLVNCAFLGNTATSGGAVYNYGPAGNSSPVLTNCSFQSNTASFGGGAIYSDGSSSGISTPSLTNCVLFGNGGNKTFYNTAATITATYSLFDNTVTGYSGSTGNLTTVTSLFISTTSVALVACSPAINAGLNSANSTTVDLAGNPRVVEGRIDMGAVEFQGATTLAVGVTANPSLTITQGQTATLTASDALSYSWSAGMSTTAISVSVAGPYTVTGVTGSCSGTATVTVSVTAAPPSVTAQPASASTVCVGASGAGLPVLATVGVSGSVSGYQWLKGGSPVPGQTGPMLLLGNVQLSDAGVYSLSVSGPGGSTTSSNFTLTVNPTPTATITFPNSVTVQGMGVPIVRVPALNPPVVFQASGGTIYERVIIVDRINGYEIRQNDSNTTGIFPINRLGLFTLTVRDISGCSRTVQWVVERQ
jgi:predicted outer membrane repeat protein